MLPLLRRERTREQRPSTRKVAPRRGGVAEDARFQRLRVGELALFAHAPEKLDGNAPRSFACQRIEQEGLDRQLRAVAKRGPVADVGDGIPRALGIQIAGARDVYARFWNQLGGRSEERRVGKEQRS